jgi:hypothetical protein
MIFMLICTEGKVSEPAYIRALESAVRGQAPMDVSMNIEVLPVPLGGNHGHAKLVETADGAITDYGRSGSLLSLAGDDDVIEKWIIVDHDDMEKHGVEPEGLRQEAQEAGYSLVISKPNFELFVLAGLSDLATAMSTDKKQLKSKINTHIARLNQDDVDQKGFTKPMLMPKYSKKEYVADKLFKCMLGYHPELVQKMAALQVDVTAEQYTEMPKVVQRILELYTYAEHSI